MVRLLGLVVPAPASAPLQAVKTKPLSGTAVRVTIAPATNEPAAQA